jgi:hypothetical protein
VLVSELRSVLSMFAVGGNADIPFQSIAPARAALRGAMEGEDIGV